MRLTSFTDFALRALMRLAGEPDRSFATNEIAAEFGISRNHLAKVVRDLADSGFIATQRGVGGGFSLARPAQSITIGYPRASVVGKPHECGLVPRVGNLPPNGTTSASAAVQFV